MAIYKEIDFELFNKYLSYDSDSPSGLIWKKSNNSKNPKTKRKIGELAGHICTIREGHKVWQVTLMGKTYYAHRVVYVLNHKHIDSDMVINHIDCNPLNNNINNLEVCSIEQNNQRTKYLTQNVLMKTNSSTKTGLREEIMIRNGKEFKYVRVFCSIDGKLKSKKFSYLKYGKHAAWKLAEQTRNEFLNIRGKK